jgi:hypothetical protein
MTRQKAYNSFFILYITTNPTSKDWYFESDIKTALKFMEYAYLNAPTILPITMTCTAFGFNIVLVKRKGVKFKRCKLK